MYRQKSVIFTIGKTLYIKAGQEIKENKGLILLYIEEIQYLPIYKETSIILARYKRKGLIYLYRQNTPYIRKYIGKTPIRIHNKAIFPLYIRKNTYIGYINAYCQI